MPPVHLSSLLKAAEKHQQPERHCLAPTGKEICPHHIKQECHSHPSSILKSHLRKKPEVYSKEEVVDMITRVGTPQQLQTKSRPQLTL